MNKLYNNSSLSDKGSTTVKLHTKPFPRPTSNELYKAYTDKLSSASFTASICFTTQCPKQGHWPRLQHPKVAVLYKTKGSTAHKNPYYTSFYITSSQQHSQKNAIWL